jgi:antitoxin (DNA-binding transcriptional repressor) of toxin-antitoxin stability system
VDGRPVADLIPVADTRRTYVPRDEIAQVLAHAPLDPLFARDVHAAVGDTIEDL